MASSRASAAAIAAALGAVVVAYLAWVPRADVPAVATGLAIVAVGAVFLLTRQDVEPWARWYLAGLLFVKVLVFATFGKDLYAAVMASYDGREFIEGGARLAARADGLVDLVRDNPVRIGASGSGNLTLFVAVLVLLGATATVVHMVFACFGVGAAYFAYRTVRTAFPDVRPTGYLLLASLLPSTFAFSALVLKDGPTLFAVALFLYGTALLAQGAHRRAGAVLLAATLLAAVVRPYVGFFLLFACCAAVAALVWKRARSRRVRAAVVAAVAVFLVAGASVTGAMLFGERGLLEGLADTREAVVHGKERDPGHSGAHVGGEPIRDVGDLVRLPWYVLSVMFRPFLWEARNAASLVAAFENLLLLFVAWRIVLAWPVVRADIGHPTIVASLAIAAAFAGGYAFIVENLGTVFRIKGLVYPGLFLVYSVAEARLASRGATVGRSEATAA